MFAAEGDFKNADESARAGLAELGDKYASADWNDDTDRELNEGRVALGAYAFPQAAHKLLSVLAERLWMYGVSHRESIDTPSYRVWEPKREIRDNNFFMELFGGAGPLTTNHDLLPPPWPALHAFVSLDVDERNAPAILPLLLAAGDFQGFIASLRAHGYVVQPFPRNLYESDRVVH